MKSINSTCPYTASTYMSTVLGHRGDAIKQRCAGQNELKDGGGVQRDGGSRQGGKLNVTFHIWLFTSHLTDTFKISGGKITGLILLYKDLCLRECICCFKRVKFPLRPFSSCSFVTNEKLGGWCSVSVWVMFQFLQLISLYFIVYPCRSILCILNWECCVSISAC